MTLGSRPRSTGCGAARGRRAPVLHEQGAPALVVSDLTVAYGGRIALADVSFELPAGARLAVVGPNGAGKTSLLKAISGLLPWARGTIEIHGHEPRGHICIGYVPQRTQVDWRFPVTVYDVVMMGRIGRLGPLRRVQSFDRRIVKDALARVGLETFADRQIEELSGGQQQRMFIARTMAQEASIVLMDEPFAGLDVSSRDGVLTLLGQVEGTTLLVALHDLGIASAHFDHALLLKGRMIGFGAPAEVFQEAQLRQAYGSCLRMIQSDEGVLVVHDTTCSGEGP
jgi:ABC-type Mn2+/Zn2+ transport system ATPase subunit